MEQSRFGPPVHPGGILREVIIPGAGMTAETFTVRLGLAPGDLAEVLAERAPVTGQLALRIGRLLGAGGPDHWMALQAAYDLAAARVAIGHDVDRIQPLPPEPGDVQD